MAGKTDEEMNEHVKTTLRLLPALLPILIVTALELPAARAAEPAAFRVEIDWPAFLERHDMVWERLSTKWGDAAFEGNGHMGAMIFKADSDALKLELGHNAITLPVTFPDAPDEPLMGQHILIGEFVLVPAGEIEAGSERMRMDLWNAETRGEFKTTKGSISWRSFIHATKQVLALEVAAEGEEAEGLRLEWRAEKPVPANSIHKGFPESPSAALEKHGDIHVHVQRYKAGGLHAVAWAEIKIPPQRRVLYASWVPSFPGEEGIARAVQEVKQASGEGFEKLLETHRQWWHAFWPVGGFVSMSDGFWENFYWVQMYRLASAMRADSVVIDGLNGPWLQDNTGWPFWAWNLNVQLCYWPQNAANRLELGESLYSNMDKYADNFIRNVAPEYRADAAGIGWAGSWDFRSNVLPRRDGKAPPWHQTLGDLPWLCHNYWLHYRHLMDDERLKTRLFPLLKRAVNFYLYFLDEKADGRLHLIPTHSPELATVPNCNFDLALLRWGCETLLKICDRLGIDDPLRDTWRDVLERLVPFPADDGTGLLLGEGKPLEHMHRHYSHLLAIYPLYLLNMENPQNRELAEKSLNHYLSLMEKGGDTMGFAITGASSMTAALGHGDKALELLNFQVKRGHFAVNLTDLEGGGNSSLESTFSPVQCIHDMLIQSWGDRIRVFPAVPSTWANVAIHNMRTEGAFLISAVRENGKTRFIRVESLAGEPCRIVSDLKPPVKVLGNVKMATAPDGAIELELKRGEAAVLCSEDDIPEPVIRPAAAASEIRNRFGLKK